MGPCFKIFHIAKGQKPTESPHDAAMCLPREGFEISVRDMVRALAYYADAHQKAYGSKIAEDPALGMEWLTIASAVVGLLNGQTGRLDCGTVEAAIRDIAAEAGFNRELEHEK